MRLMLNGIRLRRDGLNPIIARSPREMLNAPRRQWVKVFSNRGPVGVRGTFAAWRCHPIQPLRVCRRRLRLLSHRLRGQVAPLYDAAWTTPGP